MTSVEEMNWLSNDNFVYLSLVLRMLSWCWQNLGDVQRAI